MKNRKKADQIGGTDSHQYDLFGVIVHSGSSRSFGHYYSYCRGTESPNTWYKCNDESVSRLQNGADGALGKEAYILFYQKRMPQLAEKEKTELNLKVI